MSGTHLWSQRCAPTAERRTLLNRVTLTGNMVNRVLLLLTALWSPFVAAWDDALLGVPLVIDGRSVPYPVFAIYAMPGQVVSLFFRDATAGGEIRFQSRSGTVGEFEVIAPAAPGLYPIEIENAASGEIARVNLFVRHPFSEIDSRGRLNGYRIGAYPAELLRGNEIYLPPSGFVEVTAANAAVHLSPNFTLGQFVSKQAGGYPKYVALRADLLLKLENILATLNRSGHATDGFVIMSGFRTPWYNRAIGNVPYSRHVWGGAADIYIDQAPRDGRMDDLDGNGRIDRDDARWFAAFVNQMSMRGDFGPRIGGLGIYGSTAARGPFVHVDVRGTRARW